MRLLFIGVLLGLSAQALHAIPTQKVRGDPYAPNFHCTPRSTFVNPADGCNTCTCKDDGTTAGCTQMACSEEHHKTKRSFSSFCQPGTMFYDGCNHCMCPSNGNRFQAGCTMRGCPDSKQETFKPETFNFNPHNPNGQFSKV